MYGRSSSHSPDGWDKTDSWGRAGGESNSIRIEDEKEKKKGATVKTNAGQRCAAGSHSKHAMNIS